jgi:site-specific recombinase XerD
MGHASISTTASHIHLDNEDLANAFKNTLPGMP